jgi:hypothetical protein
MVETVLAEVKSVVAGKKDDRVIKPIQCLQLRLDGG